MSDRHTVVVVPDCHVEPGRDNTTRFRALGRLISVVADRATAQGADRITVVQLGDLYDMASMSGYDRGTKSFEGRRYLEDLGAGVEAVEALHSEIEDMSVVRRVFLLGNHEDRIDKAVNRSPEWEGLIGTNQLAPGRLGWQVVPYQTPYVLGGVSFCHNFPSGVKGRPIGGASHAKSMCQLLHTSAVAGHSHLLDRHVESCPDGRRVMATVAGCFFEHDHEWAGPANRMYWRGVLVLHDVQNGAYDVEEWSLDRLMHKFGG